MSTKKTPVPAKKKAGRPPVAEGEPTVTMNVRLSLPQRQKVDRHGGGPWVRLLIDKAKG